MNLRVSQDEVPNLSLGYQDGSLNELVLYTGQTPLSLLLLFCLRPRIRVLTLENAHVLECPFSLLPPYRHEMLVHLHQPVKYHV